MARECSICVHPQLEAINKAEGSTRDIAKRFGVGRNPLGTHRANETGQHATGTARGTAAGTVAGQAGKPMAPTREQLAARAQAGLPEEDGQPEPIPATGDRDELAAHLWQIVRFGRTEGARTAAAKQLDDLLPPVDPGELDHEPTVADARREIVRLFGDAVGVPLLPEERQ